MASTPQQLLVSNNWTYIQAPRLRDWVMRRNGFVRVEVIIILVILLLGIGVALSAWLSARSQVRDKQRVMDVGQIQKALAIYFQENGFYPTANNGIPADIKSYLDFWPKAPMADGSCTGAQNEYSYSQLSQGADYNLSFCLGQGGRQIISSKTK